MLYRLKRYVRFSTEKKKLSNAMLQIRRFLRLKSFDIFSYFFTKTYVVSTHLKHRTEKYEQRNKKVLSEYPSYLDYTCK